MTMRRRAMTATCSFVVCLFLGAVATGAGPEEQSLQGVKQAKAVFDVRTGSPKVAAISLELIHEMLTNESLTSMTNKPDFVVVFIGPAVKLVSKNVEGASPEEQEKLSAIANTIAAMAKDGIRLEICLFAANLLKVDPASVLPEIEHVENGWTSLIGYQAKGYPLVPVY
jgi:intracellular sulfur oxidation DsrE/DsrF family protein